MAVDERFAKYLGNLTKQDKKKKKIPSSSNRKKFTTNFIKE